MYTGNRMMYHKAKKMADGCKSVDKSKERMDAARCAGGALGNRCGNDLRPCQLWNACDSRGKAHEGLTKWEGNPAPVEQTRQT